MTDMHLASDIGTKLSFLLLERIKKLVHGNHISASEVKGTEYRFADCKICLDVHWEFKPHKSTRSFAGNAAIKGAHHGYDRDTFDEETNRRINNGYNSHSLRNEFQKRVIQSQSNALLWSHLSQVAWDFGEHSVHRDCEDCDGTAKVKCYGCSGLGKNHCYHCHGSGQVSLTRFRTNHNGQQTTEHYQQSCNFCYASGQLSCSTCGGNGKLQCRTCSGHGYFTDVTHIVTNAHPSIFFTTYTKLSASELSNYLCQIGSYEAAQHLPFQLSENINDNDKWVVKYSTETTVIEQDFSIRNKKYMCAAVGNVPLPFVRPSIFDELFIEELTALKAIYANKKSAKINKARAISFFKNYTGQPVLDNALQRIAKLSANDRKTPETALIAACDGFIGKNSAAALGKCMADLLDKISPAHSPWAWGIVMFLPISFIFFTTENTLEIGVGDFLTSLITSIILAVAGTLFLILISPLAWLPSVIVSAIRRRSIPKPYRQLGRNWEPLSVVLKCSLIATIIAGSYGLSARHDYVPRWGDAPSNFAKNQIIKHKQYFQSGLDWLGEKFPSTMALLQTDQTDSRQNLADTGLECQLAWARFSKLPEGAEKKKQLAYYKVEYGANNFHANCGGSAHEHKCNLKDTYQKMPEGVKKDQLRQYLQKPNFDAKHFNSKLCR